MNRCASRRASGRAPWRALLLLAWLSALGLLAPTAHARPPRLQLHPNDDPAARAAETRLVMGRLYEAISIASECVADRPDVLRCRSVRGRALAQAGRCEEALEDLARVRGSDLWDDGHAMQEGICRQRVGDLSGARAALDEAVLLDPVMAMPVYQRAMVALRQGDLDQVHQDLAAIPSLRRVGHTDVLLELALLESTDADALDRRLAAPDLANLTGEDRGFIALVQLVRCQRWLDVGHPRAAVEAGSQGMRRVPQQARVRACVAEGLRRAGEAEVALGIASPAWLQATDSVALDAVAVRALVDLGRLPEAEERLASLPDLTDPEGAAAAWYLARAEGDEAGMASLADRFRRLEPRADRTLDRYVPFSEVR